MPSKAYYSGGVFSSGDEGDWDWPSVLFSSADWDVIYSDPDNLPQCSICDETVSDRRFCCAFQILRAWELNAVVLRFAHVECLRRVMHPAHKLH